MIVITDDREHNWPLVMFTVLGPASVGCLLGSLIFGAGNAIWEFSVSAVTAALLLAGLAVLLSLAHLNKPLRAYRALRRFPRSALSRETGLYSIYVVLLGVYWLLVIFNASAAWPGAIAFLAGIAAVYASAQVYLIPARPSWYHWSTPVTFGSCALSLGLSTILSIALGWPDLFVAAAGAVLLIKALVVVGVLGTALALWQRIGYLQKAAPDTRAAWQLVTSEYSNLWRLRLIVGLALPVLAVALSFTAEATLPLAWLALLLGELLDRNLFFVSSVPLSFQGELARARR